jgi:Abnormal spindle-like microcephaly-assoc'd, ASPM-SPD-2-Hydin
VKGNCRLRTRQWQPRWRLISSCLPIFVVLVTSNLLAQSQLSLRMISWNGNTSDSNALLGITSIRLGCSSTPDFCFTNMQQVASSQDVQQIYLSIKMDPNTSATYAAQFSQWSLTHPVLFSVGFDDLVNRMEHMQTDFGIAQPGTIVTDTLNAAKSANPNLKFAVTMYEDSLGSPLLADSNLPQSTRNNVDYVQLYVHYREDGPNYATYVQQTKALFPNAKIIAGAYAYDRIDYLPCSPGGVPCTTQQEEDLFQQLFLIQLNELAQGVIDQVEFFPGFFGMEAQWPAWSEPRRCTAARLEACIANTIAMRQSVLQGLSSTFGPPGPLTSLSPRPLDFPVQDLATTSGTSTVTLNNPGTGPLNISSIAIAGGNASEFSQQNSCPATLAASSNCSIALTFTPGAVGLRAAQLVVTDNSRRSPHSMDLAGVGANSTAPQVLLSPATLDFKNQPVGTTSASLVILVSNTGQGDLSFSSITITAAGSPQFAQTNNCGTGIAPAGSCSISVTFTPSTSGNQSAQLVITDNAVGSPHLVPLVGIGADPAVAQVVLSSTVLSFDSQTVNTSSAAQSVSLSNPSSTALVITQVAFSGTNAGDFSQTNNCGSTLPASSSCTFSIVFRPSGTGPRSAQLLVSDNANGSPQGITLNGIGATVSSPVATVSPSSLTFPSQTVGTTSGALSVVLTNTGNASLTLTSVGISGSNPVDFAQTNDCGNALSAGNKCTIRVSFAPAATGTRSAQLQIIDNATGSPQIVPLLGGGMAVAAPAATFSPTSLNFGDQPVGVASPAMAITLGNTGSSGLVVSNIMVSGTNGADFAQTNTCTGTIAAGANCMISVIFTPAAIGSRSAQLEISDNSSGSPQRISLSGVGAGSAAPGFTITAAPMAASVTPGQSATFSVSVLGSAGFNQAVQFACSGLPAGSSCSFSPSSVMPPKNSAATSILTISTVRSGGLFPMPEPPSPVRYQGALRILAIGVVLWMYRARKTGRLDLRTLRTSMFAATIVCLAGVLVGCGITSNSGSGSPGGVTAGTYTVTVTASSLNLSQQLNLSLTVK